jgi:hypothetical protein
MIINTGQRTDIPAIYATWFANRLKEGFVCVRNPFNPKQVSRYVLDPSVVDGIGFCTKNPEPMFPYMDLLSGYGQYWFVTITPYGRDIEPNVPDKHHMLEVFRQLSQMVGNRRITWRYDPVFVSERYTAAYHIRAFSQMAEALSGCTDTVVVSFIDLYRKVQRNFPQVRSVTREEKIALGKEMIKIAEANGMRLVTCAEGRELAGCGADCSGCMPVSAWERAIGKKLAVPPFKPAREGCSCYLAHDIGAYDSCSHLCRYCYANSSPRAVAENRRRHDPASPFLIGRTQEGDIITQAKQVSWVDGQMSLF